MTQDFTTPEFATQLNNHGIEANTPFVWCTVNGKQLLGVVVGTEFMELETGDRYELTAKSDLIPAYLVSEVLRWLPSYIEPISMGYGELKLTPQFRTYRQDRDLIWAYQNYIEIVGNLSIEQLITQGLTKGWLNKDNLNL